MKRTFSLGSALCTAALCTFTTLAADKTDEKQEADKKPDKIQQLDGVIVTATKTERNIDDVANSVTVIGKEQLQRKGHTTIADALVGTPGIDMARNGGPGTNTSIFMRGADSKNILVLVDGIPVNDPSNANRNPALANISTANIERIEIIRGPQSVLYGSNAAAGVINIITTEGKGEPTFTLRSEAGSFKTFQNNFGGSGRLGGLSYSFDVDFFENEGYSVANRNNEDIPHAGNTNEKDGYRNLTYSTKLRYHFTEDFDIGFTGRKTEAAVELDDNAGGYAGDEFGGWPTYAPMPDGNHKQETHTDETVLRADIHNRFSDGLFESTFYATHTDLSRQAYDADGNDAYDFVGKNEQYGWQGNVNMTSNILSVGADHNREFADSTSYIGKLNADTRSLWLQDQIEEGGFYTVLGARYDKHDNFGEHVTWRVAPAYTFATETKIKASYGTGYRAPSLYELYNPSYGNSGLLSEESAGWDFGLEQNFGEEVKVGATYFSTEYDEKIDWVMTSLTPFAGQYQNVEGDTDIQGIELFGSYQVTESLGLDLNYTYTDTETEDGSRLVRRPLNKASLSTTYKILKNAGMNLNIQYVGERDASPYSNDKDGIPVGLLEDYILIHLSAYYNVTDGVKIFARIDNVTDEFYETAWSYATPERSYFAGIEWTF